MHTEQLEKDETATRPDKFQRIAALMAEVIMTHPNREQYERAFYELFGSAMESAK